MGSRPTPNTVSKEYCVIFRPAPPPTPIADSLVLFGVTRHLLRVAENGQSTVRFRKQVDRSDRQVATGYCTPECKNCAWSCRGALTLATQGIAQLQLEVAGSHGRYVGPLGKAWRQMGGPGY